MPGHSPAAIVCLSIASLLPVARCLPGESSSDDKETLVPRVTFADARDDRAASRVEEVGTQVPTDEAACDAGSAPDATTSGDEASTGGGDADPTGFSACGSDGDCVAVSRGGCCDNGWLVAINATQVAAYEASVACQTPRPICAMYKVIDTRVAKCDPATRQCVMVAPDDGGDGD